MSDETNEQIEESAPEVLEAAAGEAQPEAGAPDVEPAAEEAEVAKATGPAVDEEPSPAESPEQPAETPKKKRKRLPRSERPARTKRKRARPTERKPIVRLPKPEVTRGRRQERQGTVLTAASDKTIVVRVDVVKVHPRYKKVVRRSTKLHAHDERNEAKAGDIVRIVETRPLSRMKRWRLQEIVEAAK